MCSLLIQVLVKGKVGTSGTVHAAESSQENVAVPLNGLESRVTLD